MRIQLGKYILGGFCLSGTFLNAACTSSEGSAPQDTTTEDSMRDDDEPVAGSDDESPLEATDADAHEDEDDADAEPSGTDTEAATDEPGAASQQPNEPSETAESDGPGDAEPERSEPEGAELGPRCAPRDLPPGNGTEIHVEPGAPGRVMVDGQESTLRSVVADASPGDTVLLADGTYTFEAASGGSYTGIYVTTEGITIRGESGDRSTVVLDSAYVDHNEQTAPITIAAPNVTLAHFTVKRSIFHLIHLWAEADNALIHDVTLEDGGQQFLKASPGDGTVDGVEVSCSRFVMTEEGRRNVWGYGAQDGNTTCYTGGIDTHDARDWSVVNNDFTGIYCDTEGGRPAHGQEPDARDGQSYAGGLAEHAIHMWNAAEGHGHHIEGNRIVDCARGIGLGLRDEVHDSRILNNMVASTHPGSREHDVGIIVERGRNILVAHNSVAMLHPEAYPNAIELRWGETSDVLVTGNLTTAAIAERDGASTTQVDNVSGVASEMFAAPETGDLHLVSCDLATEVAASSEVSLDYDGEEREVGAHVGADQCVE